MPEKAFQAQVMLAERARLQTLASTGSATAHAITHARIFLKADAVPDGPVWTDAMIHPKHGSWLNMAEMEARVLRRQCLDGQRIPDRDTLTHELQAWEVRCNARGVAIDWRFSLDDA